MSFGEISTSFINDLVNKANIENVSKCINRIKINGHDCEVKNGKLNLRDISDAFGIKNAIIREWKTKNGAYLQKHYGEEVKTESETDSETKRKPIIDMNCRYIDPRFLIQCMMGSSIEFNNWVTNIILGSFLYCNENEDDSLFKYLEKLNENISNIQEQIEAQRKENETIQKEKKKSLENDSNITKYMVVGFPTDKDFGRPYIKIINSDKFNDQIAKLKKQGNNPNGYKLLKIEFSNNIKLKAAIQQYLKDKDIKHNPSNIQISLTDSFTKEYFDSIKDEMKKNVEEIMEALSKTEAEKKGKSKPKKSDQLDTDFEDEDEVKEEKPKETKKKTNDKKPKEEKPKETKKKDTKKETKEVPKQEPKVETKPKTSSGKFDGNQVKFDDDDFEFTDEEF